MNLYQPDLIILTETWCNNSISNAVISVPGYFIDPALRLDRTDTLDGKGGGIIVYVRNGLTILSCDYISSNFNQYCCFQVKSEKECIEFICVYRSPNSSDENDTYLCEDILNYMKKRSDCVLIGDINLPGIDWNKNSSDKKGRLFLNNANNNLLTQCIDFPTHIKGNILDLLIINNSDIFLNADDVGRLGKSDHVMLLINLKFKRSVNKTVQHIPDWSKGDLNGFREELSKIEWCDIYSNMNCNGAWSHFENTITDLTRQFIPTKLRRQGGRPPWLNRNLLKQIRKKRQLWRVKKSTGSETANKNYMECERKVQKAVRNAKKNFERKLANKEKNERAFNAYVKSKTSCNNAIGPLMKDNGEVISDDREMATELNSFFGSVFTKEDTNTIPSATQLQVESTLSYAHFSPGVITRKISKLKPASAPGVDGISARLLQAFSSELSLPLSIIFTKSMSESTVPAPWKDANVTPIFKKGSRAKAGNHRPVSLTSIPCKIMESIIKDHIVDHLDANQLINASQHGFMKSRSCVTNLLQFLEVVTSEVDKGQSLDLVYLDYAKAFDKVPKLRLLEKMKAHGIGGNLLRWIECWLTNRRQRVVLNGKYSDWIDVLSGVPQGSVLGPLGFVIFINDLDEAAGDLITVLSKFADDTKAGQVLSVDNNSSSKLQTCLDNFCKWSLDWGMEFNTAKCKIMHVGNNNPGHDYYMFGQKLSTSTEEKDVGVLVHNSLKPAKQCSQAANKAKFVLSQISRAFHYRDKHTFLNLYKRYVRPHLEYCTPAWSPWSQQDIDTLEDVQKKAVNMVSGLASVDYEGKLSELKLESLIDRRSRADMVQTYKIVHGFDKLECSEMFTMINQGLENTRVTRLRADSLNIKPSRCNIDVRKNFFTQRIVNMWNSLPADLKRARNPDIFKRQFDVHIAVTNRHEPC